MVLILLCSFCELFSTASFEVMHLTVCAILHIVGVRYVYMGIYFKFTRNYGNLTQWNNLQYCRFWTLIVWQSLRGCNSLIFLVMRSIYDIVKFWWWDFMYTTFLDAVVHITKSLSSTAMSEYTWLNMTTKSWRKHRSIFFFLDLDQVWYAYNIYIFIFFWWMINLNLFQYIHDLAHECLWHALFYY